MPSVETDRKHLEVLIKKDGQTNGGKDKETHNQLAIPISCGKKHGL